MDALSETLHEVAEALPGGLPAADQVRHSAERARRMRRSATGAAVVGLLAVIALGVGVLGGGDRSQPVPAGPTRGWFAPEDSVFTADPLVPKAGWVAITSGEYSALRDLDAPGAQALEDDEGIVMTPDTPRPLDCITNPHDVGADELYGAAILQPGKQIRAVPSSGRLNEYVLWFDDPSEAARAFAGLREEFQACRARKDSTHDVENSYLAYDEAANPPIEEQFTGEITRVPKDGGDDGYRYGLSVARIGSLVVLYESLEASPGRPTLTLYALTTYAMNRLSPTVDASG